MTSTRKFRVSAETMHLAKILWKGVFQVPWHQREFDWEPENVEQFWDDIQRNVENDEEDYFIGSITLTQENDHLFYIQDGQQRLTTYSMMLAALLHKVPDEHKARVYTVIYDIEHGMMPTGTDNLRIRHQESDQNTYSSIMNGEQLSPNGKLHKAQVALMKKTSQLNQIEAISLLDYLLAFVIANRTINRTDNATQVFETLNARGKEVDEVDLLRNFLYSHLESPYSNLALQIHRNLEDMKEKVRTLWKKRGKAPLDVYVQCALKCRYGHIRKNYLYQDAKHKIQEEITINGKENAEKTVRELTAYLCNPKNINVFMVLFQGNEYADEINSFTNAVGSANRRRNMHDYVRELSEYKAVSLPITFAVMTRFLNAPTEEQKPIAKAGQRIVQDLDALIMRTAIVQMKFAPSVFEVAIAKWGKEIMDSINSDTQRRISKEIIKEDRNQVLDDSLFQEEMVGLRFPNKKDASKAKHMLYSLYRRVQSDLPQFDNRLTLEHVLPESADHVDGWGPHFTDDNHERYAKMLGNMTLLMSSDNKGTTSFNETFENKKPTLQNSAILANRAIADNDNWTPAAIQRRQHRLAKEACQVWKPSGR